MLKSLTLINFRSHPHTVIDLTTGVNILVGRGQAGKTNIKRALEWLYSNRPLGTKVHSWWCKEGQITSVRADTMEGYQVTISKAVGGSVEYKLVGPNGKAEHFRKVGGKVPDQVTQVLNLGELNLQGQLDQPYLVTAGTGEISRAVNQVVDLEAADEWLSELASRRQRNTMAINNLKQQHTDALNGLKAYNTLPNTEKVLKSADRVQTALNKTQQTAQGLQAAITTVNQAEEEVARLKPIHQAAKEILERAEALAAGLKAKRQEQRVYENFFDTAQAWYSYGEQYEEAVTHYMVVLNELGICPTCYGPVTQETLDNIAEQLSKGVV